MPWSINVDDFLLYWAGWEQCKSVHRWLRFLQLQMIAKCREGNPAYDSHHSRICAQTIAGCGVQVKRNRMWRKAQQKPCHRKLCNAGQEGLLACIVITASTPTWDVDVKTEEKVRLVATMVQTGCKYRAGSPIVW